MSSVQTISLVSIIMPVHNNEKFVGEAIKSVLNQDYKNFELLIVDDGSTDKSLFVIQSFSDSRIRLFINQGSFGAAAARNVALRNAHGKYIAFLDADDVWKKEKLRTQIDYMERNNISFCCSRYTVVSASGEPKYDIKAPKRISKKSLVKCCYIGCLTAIYDQTISGVIQVDERLKKRNDYAIWLQVINKIGFCYYIDKSLAFYRLNSFGISSKKIGLIKWHYRLFRWQFHKNKLISAFYAVTNLIYYVIKRVKYKKACVF